MKAKYQIAASKVVVGVDRPMKALSMHMQKPYYGKVVKVLVKKNPSCICYMCPHCEGKVSKAVVGVNWSVYAVS